MSYEEALRMGHTALVVIYVLNFGYLCTRRKTYNSDCVKFEKL